jgi:hypothetical protein
LEAFGGHTDDVCLKESLERYPEIGKFPSSYLKSRKVAKTNSKLKRKMTNAHSPDKKKSKI